MDPGTGAVTLEGSRPSVLREILSGAPQDFSQGSLARAVFIISAPGVLVMSIEALYGFAELAFAARLGSDALAALGFAQALLAVPTMIGGGLMTAAMAIVSRRVGEQRLEAAGASAVQLIWLALGLGLGLGAVLGYFTPELLRLVGASEGVVRIGTSFTRTLLGCCAVELCLSALVGIFQAAGAAALILRAVVILPVLFALCPVLMFGVGSWTGMGLMGAAVAAMLARACGAAALLGMLFSGKTRLQVRSWRTHPKDRNTTSLLKVAVGGAAQMAGRPVGVLLLMRLIAPFGAAVVAAQTITERLVIMLLLPTSGLAEAVSMIVGQSLGAGRLGRAIRVTWRMAGVNGALLVVACLLYFLSPHLYLQPFVDDPEVLHQSARFLSVTLPALVPMAVGVMLSSALNGAGDAMTPAVLVFAGEALLLGLAYFLSRGPLQALAFPSAFAITQVVSMVVLGAVFLRGKWKTSQI
jgi:putative MATE family efflux protein